MQARTRKNARAARPRKRPARDPQRQKLYGWEGDWKDWRVNSITAKQCKTLIRKYCRWWRVVTPALIFKHQPYYEGGPCWAWHNEKTWPHIICLKKGPIGRPGSMNRATVLHELAHHVCELRFSRTHGHGRTFLAVYLILLRLEEVAPLSALKASARKYGLKWRRTVCSF